LQRKIVQFIFTVILHHLKIILCTILTTIYYSSFSQNLEFEKAYKYLITNIYNDTTFQITGNLLPYPGEVKNNSKKNIIYIKSTTRHSNLNRMTYLDKNSKILFDIDTNINSLIKKVNFTLINEQIIDTNYNTSKDYKFNLLGWLVINNIYVRKNYKPNNFNEIFFEIIRIGRDNTKSQSLEIVHMIKINGEWKVKETHYLERS
jgi:hypothetical protein